MPFIEIITDTKSQMQLNKSIKKEQVNNCEILYIKEKNIDNIKNIKLETLMNSFSRLKYVCQNISDFFI